MTVTEIQQRLRESGKPLTRPGLYFHFRALKLKPLGVARPAIYPENAVVKVAKRLGVRLRKTNGHATKRGAR